MKPSSKDLHALLADLSEEGRGENIGEGTGAAANPTTCPSLEELVSWVEMELNQGVPTSEITGQTATVTVDHLKICPACAHEVRAARLALSGHAPSASAEQIGARLRESPAWCDQASAEQANSNNSARSAGRLLSFPRRFASVLPLAAAVALAAIGIAIWLNPAPSLPTPGDVVTRGSTVNVSRPIGTVPAAPTLFEWESTLDIEEYHVVLKNVRQEILFECAVRSSPESTSCSLGESVRLEPWVRYSWQVSGLRSPGTGDGTESTTGQKHEVAKSPWITFTVEPTP